MLDDETFLKRLDLSREVADQVCDWFKSKGYNVRHPPQETRPSSDVRFDYADSGDLLLTQIIEVKYTEQDFQSVATYPFKDTIVDEQYKADKHLQNIQGLFAYVKVNKSRTGALVLRAGTYKHWYTKSIFDRTLKEERDFCMCLVEHCTFISFLSENT